MIHQSNNIQKQQGSDMQSCIVVTSWWSNCLALTSIRQLIEHAPERKLYVMQAGKSDAQMDRFRTHLPECVTELHYPSHLLADDSPMREYLVCEAMRDHEGVWFWDHDAFFEASASSWFALMDMLLEKSKICLCSREPLPGAGITMPAYWTSPRRWPQGLSSFDPIPFKAKPYSRRPDLYRHEGDVFLPDKDTLVQVREELAAIGLAGTFYCGHKAAQGDMFPAFPPLQHLGGLHLYTKPVELPPQTSESFFEWRRSVVSTYEEFFAGCPREWIDIEDPELLRRHRELHDLIMTSPT